MQIILFVLLLILVFIILLIISFKRWKKSAIRVMDEGEVMETTIGKIHYKLTGEGPVLFFMHGGPGGIDQGILLDDLVE
jgi:hypothetical protein